MSGFRSGQGGGSPTDLKPRDSVTVQGTTPTITIGDGGDEDIKLLFNSNTNDYYVGSDATDDKLHVGVGSAIGTNVAITVDSSAQVSKLNLAAAAVAVADDHIVILDGGATGAPKAESIQDLLSAIAGSGISVSGNQLVADGGGTADSVAADNISTGDAAISLATSTGNITIDAQGNNTDIIFKGTDATSDITMLTLDGSEAGAATFNSTVTATGFTIGSAAITEAELEILDGASVTTTELNLIDGDTSRGTTAVADGDGFLHNDAGTMRMTNVSKLADLFAGTGLGASSSVLSVDAAQTGITSILATDLKIGEDDETKIDFETADEIHFYAANVEQVYLADNIFGPQSDSDVDLGTTGVRWKDAYIDTITTTSTITAAGRVIVDDATEATSTTDGSLQTDGGLSVAKSAVIGDDLDLLSNGAILNIGSAQKFTATHANANNTLTITADHRLAFGDAGDYIAGDGTDLSIVSSGAANVSATMLTVTTDTALFTSANANDPLVTIRNTADDATGARLVFVKDKGSPGADGDDLGIIEFIGDDAAQTQTTFAKIVAEVSEADDSDEAGKLSFFVAESDGTTVHLTEGLILEGEHATDGQVDATIGAGAASTTTVAGDLAVTSDATVGDDLSLTSDSSVFNMGAGNDFTITHDGTTGATIAGNPIIVDSGGNLTLDAHTGIFILKDAGSEVLRLTEGNSGDVTVKLATDGKDLVFTDNGDATNMKILDAAAGINVPGEVQTTKIAFTDGDDAITIADGGGVTFSDTVKIQDDKTLTFGTGDEWTIEYDEDGDNDLVLTGSDISIESSTSAKPVMQLLNTNADANGSTFKFNKNGSSVADGDVIGNLEFVSEDDGSNVHTYGKVIGSIDVDAAGEESGKLQLQVASHDGGVEDGLILVGGSADAEVDVTIGKGTASITTIAGGIAVQGLQTTSANSSGVALTTSGLTGLTAGADSSNDTYTLANGEVNGQIKEITLLGAANPASIDNQVITVATAGWNSDSDPDGIITMTAIGDFIRLMWLNPGSGFVWVPIIRIGNTSLSD